MACRGQTATAAIHDKQQKGCMPNETYLPAQEASEEQGARFPRPHDDQGWPKRAPGSQSARAQEAVCLITWFLSARQQTIGWAGASAWAATNSTESSTAEGTPFPGG